MTYDLIDKRKSCDRTSIIAYSTMNDPAKKVTCVEASLIHYHDTVVALVNKARKRYWLMNGPIFLLA